MHYSYASISDIGIKRTVNQDATYVVDAETERGPVFIAAVCDGMGGLEHGEVASSTMVRKLQDWVEDWLIEDIFDDESPDPLEKRLFDGVISACYSADKSIQDFSEREGIRCGTTAVVLILFDGNYYIVNIGDSRAYICRRSQIEQMTKDQTVTQQLIDNGEITKEEALFHKDRSRLLQAVGMGRKFRPECKTGAYFNGDYFLLSSDGFTHKIQPSEISSALSEDAPKTAPELKDLIGYFVEENKKRKETDNISVVIVRCSGD